MVKCYDKNVVYKIENNINHMIYIGITTQPLYKRWNNHCNGPRNGRISYIQRAIQKYGRENFTLSIIEKLDTNDMLEEREKYWIKYYNCVSPKGYNLTFGGEIKKEYSEETRRKISFASSHRSKRTLLKMSKNRKGKGLGRKNNFTEEYRKKISNTLKQLYSNKENHPFFGKHHSEKTKRKLSLCHKGKHTSNSRDIKVRCIETGQIFNSMAEADRWCGIKNGVKGVIHGRQKTAGGYHWEQWINNI